MGALWVVNSFKAQAAGFLHLLCNWPLKIFLIFLPAQAHVLNNHFLIFCCRWLFRLLLELEANHDFLKQFPALQHSF